MDAAWKRNYASYTEKWDDSVFQAQNKILQVGIDLGILPNIPGWQDMWMK